MKTKMVILMATMALAGVAHATEAPKSAKETQKVEAPALKKQAKLKHRAGKASVNKDEKKGG